LDAISKIKDIVKRAKEYGHKSMALTDHGTIAGTYEFYNECVKAKIKPILASEFYMQPDADKAKEEKNRKNHHLILLAQNAIGWENIKKLTTKANEKFYYSPRIDYKDLREHGDGIICLTACLKGIVPWNIAEEKYDEAAKHAMILKDIFGPSKFFLELQDGGLDIQIKINEVMRRMADKLGLQTVGCQDAHYIDRNDVESHEAIWAIRTRQTLDMPVAGPDDEGTNKKQFRVYYSTREYWLKDACHMLLEPLTTEKGHQRMSTLTQEEVERSQLIADMCEAVEIKKEMHLPKYEHIPSIDLSDNHGCATVGPGGKTGCTHDRSLAYLKKLVQEGYEKKYKTKWSDASELHLQRLKKELDDIESAGLADYFLIVWDIVDWANRQGIPAGPGRGSAAGSMVAYCLNITKIEPIKYGLIWERFYNAGRKGSLADIDLDFSKKRREEVVEYIRDRFGADRVAQMVTHNNLKPRAALKDTAKILGKEGLGFDESNAMTKFVHVKAKTIEQAINGDEKAGIKPNEKLKEYEQNNPKLFRIAKMLQGSPKSRGKHAAGVIISDKPFKEGFPLCWDTKNGVLVTEYNGETLDSLGYLKMDILGLKTMDVLFDTQVDANNRRK
jgi:DNA polymerase-3 subunit alpha